jgi:hypothetical protein
VEVERGEGGPDEVPRGGQILSQSIVSLHGKVRLDKLLICGSWSKQIIEHEKNQKNGGS